MKKSFILYQDQEETFDALTDERAGKLIKAIFDYTKGEQPKLSPGLSVVFISIKHSLNRDFEKWENIVERNRGNIKKRWLKDTKDTSGISGIPNTLVSDNDNKKNKTLTTENPNKSEKSPSNLKGSSHSLPPTNAGLDPDTKIKLIAELNKMK